jgi:hypothetical protein
VWMCDGCQEINDDNCKVCTRCGRPLGALSTSSLPHQSSGCFVETPTALRPRSRPPVPGLYATYVAIVAVSLIPIFHDGFNRVPAVLAALSAAALCVAAYHLWKDIDLLVRGIRTTGTLSAIDFYSRYDRFGNQRGGKYFTNANFTVEGNCYQVRSEFGTMTQGYEVGQEVVVWYDSGDPGVAVLGQRANYQTFLLLAAGIALGYAACSPELVQHIVNAALTPV